MPTPARWRTEVVAETLFGTLFGTGTDLGEMTDLAGRGQTSCLTNAVGDLATVVAIPATVSTDWRRWLRRRVHPGDFFDLGELLVGELVTPLVERFPLDLGQR